MFKKVLVKELVSLKNSTSFKMGGKARYLVVANDEEDLKGALELSSGVGLPWVVLGGGTNLLLADGVLNYIFIRLGKGFVGVRALEGGLLEVGAGTPVERLVRLKPYEFSIFFGLPGTVGGGLKGNAGVRIGNRYVGLLDACERVRVMRRDGEVAWVEAEALPKGYRYSGIDGIILSAVFDPERLREFWGIIPQRPVVEPFPNAGCVFKNPSPEWSAGRLIDELGFKGVRRGDAMVSRLHANFILNVGDARFEDVMGLVEEIQDKAKRERGIDLELEIQVIR